MVVTLIIPPSGLGDLSTANLARVVVIFGRHQTIGYNSCLTSGRKEKGIWEKGEGDALSGISGQTHKEITTTSPVYL